MDQSLMAQHFQQTAIDLDADGDALIVVTAPAAPTATEITTCKNRKVKNQEIL